MESKQLMLEDIQTPIKQEDHGESLGVEQQCEDAAKGWK